MGRRTQAPGPGTSWTAAHRAVQQPVVKPAVSGVKKGVVSASKGLHKRKSKVGSVGLSRGLSSGKKSPKLLSSRRQDPLGLSVSDLRENEIEDSGRRVNANATLFDTHHFTMVC
jgi:hypothetical protein